MARLDRHRMVVPIPQIVECYLLHPSHKVYSTIVLTSDASGSRGPIYSLYNWLQFRWPVSCLSVDITGKEMPPIVLALAI